jgi:hypothetical protein
MGDGVGWLEDRASVCGETGAGGEMVAFGKPLSETE